MKTVLFEEYLEFNGCSTEDQVNITMQRIMVDPKDKNTASYDLDYREKSSSAQINWSYHWTEIKIIRITYTSLIQYLKIEIITRKNVELEISKKNWTLTWKIV